MRNVDENFSARPLVWTYSTTDGNREVSSRTYSWATINSYAWTPPSGFPRDIERLPGGSLVRRHEIPVMCPTAPKECGATRFAGWGPVDCPVFSPGSGSDACLFRGPHAGAINACAIYNKAKRFVVLILTPSR
jgi:hypothetical protein